MPPPELKKDRLDPESVYAAAKYFHRTHWMPWCSVPDAGLGPPSGFPTDGHAVWAGFSNWDSGGSSCWENIDYIFRGGVQFNLDWFRMWFGAERYILLSAVLECWQQAPHDPCETYLTMANGDWAHGTLDDYLIPTGGSEDYIDTIPPFGTLSDGLSGLVRINVTDRVTEWLAGFRPNYGFCVKGGDESAAERSNDSCINQLSLFKLEMTYVTVNAPWEDPHPIIKPKPRGLAPEQRPFQEIAGGLLPKSYEQRLGRPVPRRANQSQK